MRFLFAIPLIIIGAFLIGNVIMDIVGWGLVIIGILIGKRKKNEHSS